MNFTDDTIIVLTVGSFAQKQLCEKLIPELDLSGMRIEVISDDEFGNRIGSGGAVLNVIGRYYETNKKLIVINSGGFSKRTFSCAVKGKAFARTLCGNKPVTLLEHIIDSTVRLTKAFSKGIILCCSDILTDTRQVNISFDNNIGFGVLSDIGTGVNHGVMLKNVNHELTDFLHKCDEKILRSYAEKNNGKVIVDTGMVFLCDEFAEKLYRLIRQNKLLDFIRENGIELNFYSDVFPLLSKNLTAEQYFSQMPQDSQHTELRKILYSSLSDCSLKVCVLENQRFMHFGTTRQLLENVIDISDDSPYLSIGSVTDDSVSVGSNTVLDGALLKGKIETGADCLINDIALNGEFCIPDGKVVCGIKLTDGSFVTVITDTDENPKDMYDGYVLWDLPRFYKGRSFSDSLKKFFRQADEEKFSLKYCTENADFNFFYNHTEYLKGIKESGFNEEYSNIRNRIISDFFDNQKKFQQLHCVKDRVEVSMPLRVNLCGTWTDAMPYCIKNGGTVINAAVTVNGELPVRVTLEKLDNEIIEFISDGSCTEFSFDETQAYDELSEFNLHRVVLQTVGITGYGQLPCGLRLSTQVCGTDKGSGLGTSSILLTACFKAFSEMFGLDCQNSEIVKMVFVAEQLMKTGGGWQDQVGGLYPGVKLISSEPGLQQKVKVKSIELPDSFKKLFSQSAVLLPTGQRHFGRFIVTDVANRYLDGNPGTVSALNEIKELNSRLLESIENEDTAAFYECINSHMQLLTRISPAVTNTVIRNIIGKCACMTEAVSICGAGAGGYLLAFLKKGVTLSEFRSFIALNFPQIKSDVLKTDIFI